MGQEEELREQPSRWLMTQRQTAAPSSRSHRYHIRLAIFHMWDVGWLLEAASPSHHKLLHTNRQMTIFAERVDIPPILCLNGILV